MAKENKKNQNSSPDTENQKKSKKQKQSKKNTKQARHAHAKLSIPTPWFAITTYARSVGGCPISKEHKMQYNTITSPYLSGPAVANTLWFFKYWFIKRLLSGYDAANIRIVCIYFQIIALTFITHIFKNPIISPCFYGVDN